MSNYYDLLGVGKDASEKDIRQAYRRLARQYHPDVNKNDATAEEKFKEINEAYGVLSDEDSRQKYDRYGDNWRRAEEFDAARAKGPAAGGFRWASGNTDFEDIFANVGGRRDTRFQNFGGGGSVRFDDLFNPGRDAAPNRDAAGRRPPPDYPVEVTLEEAFHGATRTLRTNDGRTLEVKIPAGVDQGSRVHIASGGTQGKDFCLVISLLDHDRFTRKGRNLYVEVEIPLDDAVLGAEILAATLTGQVALTVPPNTPNERRFRLSGLGMPALSGNGRRGDLYVSVKVLMPSELSDEEIELFRRFRELRLERSAAGNETAVS